MSGPRKYAVQKPKGAKWETLSLVDDLGTAKQEFRHAVESHGRQPVRLIQVDFTRDEALADFDWRLIELHDPTKGARPRPTVIAGRERVAKKAGKPAAVSPEEKVPIPIRTYIAAFLFGVLALIAWALMFKI